MLEMSSGKVRFCVCSQSIALVRSLDIAWDGEYGESCGGFCVESVIKTKKWKKKWRRVLGGASSLVSIGGIGWSLIFGVSSLPFFGAG